MSFSSTAAEARSKPDCLGRRSALWRTSSTENIRPCAAATRASTAAGGDKPFPPGHSHFPPTQWASTRAIRGGSPPSILPIRFGFASDS